MKANGEGSVYWVPSRERWVAQLYVDGKYVRRERKTEIAAEDALLELKVMRRDPIDGAVPSTLGEYIVFWLGMVQRHRIRPSSHWKYTYELDHVGRAVGRLPLVSVSPTHITKLYSGLQDGTAYSGCPALSANTVHGIHTRLKSALKRAVALGYISRNPADRVESPRRVKPQVRVLSRPEVERIFAAVKSDERRRLYRFLLLTGLRFGEAAALTWDRVQDGRIQVKSTLSPKRGVGQIEGPPKTDDSEREIAYGPATAELLRRQNVAVKERRLASGTDWTDRNLVWPNRDGNWLVNSSASRDLLRAAGEAGVQGVSLHVLRHTAATIWIHEQKMPAMVAQIRLGHASAEFTLDVYTGVSEDLEREWGEIVDAIWEVS